MSEDMLPFSVDLRAFVPPLPRHPHTISRLHQDLSRLRLPQHLQTRLSQ